MLPIAQQVISIDISGKISLEDGLQLVTSFVPEILDQEDEPASTEKGESAETETAASDAANGKLVVAEEISEGRVSWKAIKLFLSSISGEYPLLFVAISILGFIMSEIFFVSQKWFLGFWGSQYEKHDPSEVSVSLYVCFLLSGFGILICFRLLAIWQSTVELC